MAAQQGKQCTSIAIGKEGGRGEGGKDMPGPITEMEGVYCTEYTYSLVNYLYYCAFPGSAEGLSLAEKAISSASKTEIEILL